MDLLDEAVVLIQEELTILLMMKSIMTIFSFTMKNIDEKKTYTKDISHINVSSGEEIPIKDLAFTVKEITGLQGDINFDNSMADDTPRKVLDGTFLNQMNLSSKIQLEEGLKATYLWYEENQPPQ